MSNLEDDLDCDEGCKKYILELRSYKINKEVMKWVEEKITSVERRIHKFTKITLAAYIILGYTILKKDTTIEKILEKTGTVKHKKKILDLISGDSTDNTPIHELQMGMPIIVCCPIIYTHDIIKFFCISRNIEITEKVISLISKIKKFTYIMFLSINLLSNYEPKSLACVFVYFYLNYMQPVLPVKELRKITIRKTHFKTISISKIKSPDINPKDFDSCLEIINLYFFNFIRTCKKRQLKDLMGY